VEFDRGECFQQHETLEELRREEPDDVLYLCQGILLVGVGCYHLLRGNYVGAASKLTRGWELLRWFERTCLLTGDRKRGDWGLAGAKRAPEPPG